MNGKFRVRVLAALLVLLFVSPGFSQPLPHSTGEARAPVDFLDSEQLGRLSGLMVKPSEMQRGHPAYGMKRGEIRFSEEVPIEYHLDAPRDSKLISGVPMDDQAKFRFPEIEGIDEAARTMRFEQQVKYARAIAEDLGQDLSEEKQKELETVYMGLVDLSWKLDKQLAAQRITENQAIKSLSKGVVESLRQEREIFSDKPADIPERNPLRTFREKQITPELVEDLERAYEEFLTGAWMGEKDGKKEKVEAPSPTRARDYRKYPVRSIISNFKPRLSPLYSNVGGPVYTHFEFRIYTAEHSVISWLDKISPELGDTPDFKHVSVVAGAWVYEKQTRERANPPDGRPRSEYVVYEEKPIGWLVGNSCAGGYQADDDLILRYRKVFEDWDELLEFAYGVNMDPQQQECHTISVASYSIGTYGLDWVCHNLANAFTYKRWVWMSCRPIIRCGHKSSAHMAARAYLPMKTTRARSTRAVSPDRTATIRPRLHMRRVPFFRSCSKNFPAETAQC